MHCSLPISFERGSVAIGGVPRLLSMVSASQRPDWTPSTRKPDAIADETLYSTRTCNVIAIMMRVGMGRAWGWRGGRGEELLSSMN